MNEALLARIWRAQRFSRTDLRTLSGESLHVVYPGRASRGPGPDFRDALIQFGTGGLTQGDVEIHLRSSNWRAHGHQRDPAYRNVILHVVLDADAVSETDQGRIPAMLSLRDRLGDPTHYADLAAIPDIACHEVARHAGDDVVAALLDQLGDERLRGKAARFEGDLATVAADQVLYVALLDALGYSRNRVPFRALAERLPLVTLAALTGRLAYPERVERLLALFFGMAGLLPTQRTFAQPLDWLSTGYVEELEAVWALEGQAMAGDALSADQWHFAGVRPSNSPPRRAAAAAYLLAQLLEDGIIETTLDAVRRGAGHPAALVACFAVDERSSYWGTHFDFGRALGKHPASLIGGSRAHELALNVALPFALAWAQRTDDASLAELVWLAYHQMPRTDENEVTKRVRDEVFGRARSSIITSARRQQGLLHLDRRYCQWGHSDDCPVVQMARAWPQLAR